MKKNSILCTVILLVLSFTTIQCDFLDSIDSGVDQFRLFREQSIFEINSASQQIASGIGDVSQVLENLERNLPKEIRSTLTFDVPFIIDAAVGEGIIGGLCLIDAASSKALYLLEVMKSEIITGEPVPLPDPFICHTSVGAINLNQDRNQRDILEFTGYNLFLDRKFSAAFFTASGDSIPVPVGRPNQYRVASNVSNLDDNTLKSFNYLSLYYDGKPISSLFVVKKHQEPPITKLAPKQIPGFIAAYPIAKTGDTYITLPSKVSVNITFGHDRKRAWVDMNMIVDEDQGLFHKVTHAIGKSTRNYYYTAPQGWHIKKLTGQNIYDFHTFYDVTKEDDIRYTLFGQLTVKAMNSQAGSTTSGLLNFGNNVPDILLESGD